MRRILLGSYLIYLIQAASCGPRGAPAPAEPTSARPLPASAPAEVEGHAPAATARPFPPLATIADPVVRPVPGPPVVIRAKRSLTPVVVPAPDRSTIRDDLDKQIKARERLVRANPRFADQLRLAELLQSRVAVSEPAEVSQFRDRALAVLRGAVTNVANRGAPDLDRALLQYGTLLLETDAAAGRKVMLELIKQFPTSPQVGHVYLHFGEHYFGLGDLANARQFYRKVIALDVADISDYARYKLAWTELNLGNGAEALSALVALLRTNPPGDAAQRLRAEARKDLPRFYAQVGAADKARAFFARVVHGHEIDALDRLADAYEDLGKYLEARVIYDDLSATAVADARLCVWLQGASRSAEAVGDHDAEVDASRGLITAPGCRTDPDVRATVGRLARRVHLEALATRDRAALARAATLYGAYLTGAADAADAGLVSYYHAHLRWGDAMTLRDPDRAIEAWRDLAAQCARAVSSGLGQAEAAGAADCALTALENAVAIADTFDRLTPALAAQLAVSLEAVATTSGAPDRVGALRRHLQR
ncbi:MAG TPA: tetratricopeptide repeat protein [Kofleriaceae bacterium]|nr:tetratricopeptide repeat protein [Kofleriaceae bacterium]